MGAIVNVRAGLSMQGLQPLFTGNPVQHMVTQGMIGGECRVIEIIG